MEGNLFTDLYKVKENMYHDMSADDEVLELQNQVNLDIETDSVPEKLHYLLFKMTNRCNSDCKYCPQAISRTKDSDKFDIPLPLVKQTIREAAELGATAVAINGGEPLVRGDVQEVITEIVDNRMVPVLMTNGLLLPQMWEQIGDLGLRYVIISFDSIIKEIYEDQRGCNFERAMAGIEAALKLKEKYKDTEVHVSSVLTRNNHENFINLVKFMSEKGIKIHISPLHDYLNIGGELNKIDRDKIEMLVETLLKMKSDGYLIASASGFIRHLVDFFCEGKLMPDDYQCKVGYTNLFVDALMNVRPCWDDDMGVVGRLGEQSLNEIWHSERMQDCRKRMLKCQCNGCWYMCTGEVTMMIDDMLD